MNLVRKNKLILTLLVLILVTTFILFFKSDTLNTIIFLFGIAGVFAELYLDKKSIGIVIIVVSLLLTQAKSHYDDLDFSRIRESLDQTEQVLADNTNKLNDAKIKMDEANVAVKNLNVSLDKTTNSLLNAEIILDTTKKTLQQTNVVLENTKKYSYVARYGYYGGENLIGLGLATDSKLYNLMEPTYYTENNLFYYRCGEPHESTYLQVIKEFPDFPFSYFALASCKKQRNESDWNYYAKRALEIVKWTTTIGGHKKEHDSIINYLEDILKN